ncbi:helix-turn-helix domain-containing protein [Tunturiibacter gelidiferens]
MPKLRRARNWRQIDLAEQSGVHEVHISDVERGAREPESWGCAP